MRQLLIDTNIYTHALRGDADVIKVLRKPIPTKWYLDRCSDISEWIEAIHKR